MPARAKAKPEAKAHNLRPLKPQRQKNRRLAAQELNKLSTEVDLATRRLPSKSATAQEVEKVIRLLPERIHCWLSRPGAPGTPEVAVGTFHPSPFQAWRNVALPSKMCLGQFVLSYLTVCDRQLGNVSTNWLKQLKVRGAWVGQWLPPSQSQPFAPEVAWVQRKRSL